MTESDGLLRTLTGGIPAPVMLLAAPDPRAPVS